VATSGKTWIHCQAPVELIEAFREVAWLNRRSVSEELRLAMRRTVEEALAEQDGLQDGDEPAEGPARRKDRSMAETERAPA
jgi:hypothetical protein